MWSVRFASCWLDDVYLFQTPTTLRTCSKDVGLMVGNRYIYLSFLESRERKRDFCEPRLSERSEESRRAKLLIWNGCKFWPRLFVSLSVCLSVDHSRNRTRQILEHIRSNMS